jgi:hypothetical protein
MTSTIVHTSTVQNTFVTPFSYGMSGFDISLTLTYSTLQTTGLGVGSSTTPLQGSLRGASALYNVVPYGGGHIPPPSPSLGGSFQQPYGLNASSILFSGGIQRPQSYMTLVGSMSFSLFALLGIIPSLHLCFRQGETPFSINPTLCKALYLHKD